MTTHTFNISSVPTVIAGAGVTISSLDISASPVPVRYRLSRSELVRDKWPADRLRTDTTELDIEIPRGYSMIMWSDVPFTASVVSDALASVEGNGTDAGEAWSPDTRYEAGELFTHVVSQTTAEDSLGVAVPTGLNSFVYPTAQTSGPSDVLMEISKWVMVQGVSRNIDYGSIV